MRNIALLGATGSIGRSAAAVIAAHPKRFRLVAAAAHRSAPELLRLGSELGCKFLALTDERAANAASRDLPRGTRMLAGESALTELAELPEVDTVICAVTGVAGLPAVFAALRAGKRVALASKEVLVAAGDLANRIPTGEMIPVDSEHSGVFQCLAGRPAAEIERVILTASGGPFRTWSADRIARATCADAVKHPVWSMGVKTSIDSATLMNKALELIEARHLFKVRPEQLAVLIHPQSVVHALVELCDGSTIAQLANPDMKLAIQYALSYPERLAECPAGRLSLARIGKLEFESPDETRFPALALGREAMRRGGAAPAALNAANEAAVEFFTRGAIPFPRIWELVGRALERCAGADDGTLESRIAADAAARRYVEEQI